MIPLFRTVRPEEAANLLLYNFRMVLIQSHNEFHNKLMIRFRADKVHDRRVYFDRIPSQRERWKQTGGALITWSRQDPKRKVFAERQATLVTECPTRLPLLLQALEGTTTVGVVYDRPNWDAIEEALKTRRAFSMKKLVRRVAELSLLRTYVANLPTLTPMRLAQILPAPVGQSQQSCAPESLEVAARSPGSSC